MISPRDVENCLFSNDDKENISFIYSQFMKMKTFYWRKQERRRSFDLTDALLCVLLLLQILKYTNLCESKVLASVQVAALGFPLVAVSPVTSVSVNISLTKCAAGERPQSVMLVCHLFGKHSRILSLSHIQTCKDRERQTFFPFSGWALDVRRCYKTPCFSLSSVRHSLSAKHM